MTWTPVSEERITIGITQRTGYFWLKNDGSPYIFYLLDIRKEWLSKENIETFMTKIVRASQHDDFWIGSTESLGSSAEEFSIPSTYTLMLSNPLNTTQKEILKKFSRQNRPNHLSLVRTTSPRP